MDYVICPEDIEVGYLTPGKRYKLAHCRYSSRLFTIEGDCGGEVFISLKGCAHLSLAQVKDWLPGQHKGWDIYYEPRNHIEPWSATSPNYAPDCDEDGFFATPGTYTNAKTYEALIAEIDAIVEEQDAC